MFEFQIVVTICIICMNWNIQTLYTSNIKSLRTFIISSKEFFTTSASVYGLNIMSTNNKLKPDWDNLKAAKRLAHIYLKISCTTTN